MSDKVYLNGEVVPAGRAVIPVTDRAVLFGDTAFETLRAYRGRPFRLDRHLDRLQDSCRVLRLTIPGAVSAIRDAIADLIRENGLAAVGAPDAYVRITVTGGPSTGPRGLVREGRPGLFIIARPFEGYPARYYSEGIALAISGLKRNSSSPLSSIKTGNYLDSLFARQDALDRSADDAVMLTAAGNLAEATSSNLFMCKGGELETPDVGCGFLPGVTREAVIELCGRMGMTCRPVMAGPEVLLDSDEVFLTNSTGEIVPVRRVGDRVIGEACPGPLTVKIHDAYRGLVASELGLDDPGP